MPRPKAASSARATGCAGARSATVSWPPVTAAGTCAAFGSTSVSGPGQNASASRSAAGGTSAAQSRAAAKPLKCTISGWASGRPFATKMRATAAAFAASAPRP